MIGSMARRRRVTALAAMSVAAGFMAMTGAGWAEAAPRGSGELTTVLSTMSVRGVPTVAPAESPRPVRRNPAMTDSYKMPDLRWDHIAGSDRWTRAAMRALVQQGQELVETVPRDIAEWCPAYPTASDQDRRVFWVGLLSTLSKHESTYRPTAVGGGGLWYGLVQILPATARGYGCEARSGDALKDGALNMACAVRIMASTVPRDGVVSRGMRGVAADWGPFHSTRKREDMRTWLRAQPFCNGLQASMRPVQRPGGFGTPSETAEEVPLFVAWELDRDFLQSVQRGVTHPARDL